MASGGLSHGQTSVLRGYGNEGELRWGTHSEDKRLNAICQLKMAALDKITYEKLNLLDRFQ